jgi:HSP20 family protein
MNRLFDDVFRGFDNRVPAFGSLPSFSAAWPNVEISNSDKEVKITAEIGTIQPVSVIPTFNYRTLINKSPERPAMQSAKYRAGAM